MHRLVAIVLLALATALAVGCGGRQAPDPTNYTEAARYEWDRAEGIFDRRDYEYARSLYNDLMLQYPYSQYAVLAELRIADTYYRERSWARAIETYRRFVRFHPSHPSVPEAQYRIASAHVEQMPNDWFAMPPSHERDLREAQNAYAALRGFIGVYGDTEWADDAREELVVVRDRLAAHELYVAEFYMRDDNPVAAGQRARYLIDNYPEATDVPNALFIYARAMLQLGNTDDAVVALRRLSVEFGDTARGRDARRYLDEFGL